MKTSTFHMRITPELKKALEKLAEVDNRTLSDYARLVLEQHVKSMECLRELADERDDVFWIDSGEPDKTPRPMVIWTSEQKEVK